ncbi:LysR substrate-binding domain-containing protein [Brucella anthropi]|jgi:DNA-binding transcriptional LysR family regulator|uniref:LysR family transcriptional regulator n=1 Tax=Brucella anthropi TaxID=529 RepID=A0A8I0T7H3_BRUAN|nr:MULTISPECIES: LysR substrate-binding domain-containing protein [Brucella/Ochrobactrum group]QTN05411.1 LysR family transcriptional regulator [Ochrobactrum sp. EEELCW01]KAB2757195.1 LysR family transcriptional regulator [Brucella anthropi]KAB2768367.1 LysR family transcriptional regulator [Brucella anthropi]MBA8861113.1 DNA-binding transcriptional LysR family regulator [Brucella anthropi]MBE0559484.1 LysR family transcriptional regulator [Brucella anthropi]
MSTPLDLDQLQTFIAIADAGSFTRAADAVFKTQSAVSMQMRRLEERIGKPLFERDGRINRLTEEGERLLLYARRMMQLNGETIAAFDDTQLEGHVRIGTPDDYADRFLPEIMARFARSNPRVELSVVCEPTVNLDEMIRRGTLDIALVTQCDDKRRSEVVRTEPLLWVTSANHAVHEEAVLPLAVGRPTCIWRHAAIDLLEAARRDYRIIITSWSATVLAAAVLSGLAVSVLPECALRPGMRVLGEADGFGMLPEFGIGIMRGHTKQNAVVDALAQHIIESLDNISSPQPGAMASAEISPFPAVRTRRVRANELLPGW